jgi:hypothetical protein
VRDEADKKVLAKDLVGPMAGVGGGIISSEPKVIAMGFAPALISFRENTEVEESSGGEGGSIVGRNASGRKPRRREEVIGPNCPTGSMLSICGGGRTGRLQSEPLRCKT